jgi:hypothetical protein
MSQPGGGGGKHFHLRFPPFFASKKIMEKQWS